MSDQAKSCIDYKALTEDAFRGIMARALAQAAEYGLPGDHHFAICFLTDHPGVDMPDWLREKHPEEIDIVIQGWFDDLAVLEDRFSVVLNFGDDTFDAPERIVVPFRAVKHFVDPSVRFGLQFESADDDDEPGADHDEAADDEAFFADESLADAQDTDAQDDKGADDVPAEGQVVSLDAFRKK